EARRWPSEEKANQPTGAVCPRRVLISWPALGSQILTVPSPDAVARDRPSGLRTVCSRRSVCPRSVQISLPVLASQTLAVRSMLAEAKCSPVGLYATLTIERPWASILQISLPAETSQTAISPGSRPSMGSLRRKLAEASRLPSGLKATLAAGPACLP